MTRHPTDNGQTPIPTSLEDIGVEPLRAALESNPELAVRSISKLIEMSGDGNGGMPPGAHAKSVKRHNLLTIVAVLLSMGGGSVGIFYATEARTKTNEAAIEKHGAAPMHEAANERFINVENRVGVVEKAVGEIKTGQKAIKDGIDELKEEQVDDLKDKLKEAERKLERRRNRPPRDNR